MKYGKDRWLNKSEEENIKCEIFQYIKQGKIEKGVKYLVSGLNNISGVCTIESCEGHRRRFMYRIS
jgi:tRNA(Phe) wybutosine-synthesizing methylase Tyw3